MSVCKVLLVHAVNSAGSSYQRGSGAKATGIVCSKMVTFVLACMLLLPSLARAVTPETGVYYDSLRQGLGYYIEVQGKTLVMIAFAYDKQTGKPLFYYSSGTITQAESGNADSFDPPVQLVRENAYQFEGELYQFDVGPCLTCNVMNWETSEHAQIAGKVYLRFADIDRMFVRFNMNDGSFRSSWTRRQGFGRPGFNLTARVVWLDTGQADIPEPIASFVGDWVFTDLEDPSKPPMRFHFDKVIGPLPITGDIPLFGSLRPNHDYAQFIDTKQNAVLTCFEFGCGLQVGSDTVLVFKFWDVGPDSVLAYSGFKLADYNYYLYYRGEHLISGIRITDPIPDAPPPPTDTEGQP